MDNPRLRGANARRAADGAAGQVAQAYLALRRATDPVTISVLRARVDHPDDTLGQIAERLGVTKSVYWGRLRRALVAPQAPTRAATVPEEHQQVVLRAGTASPRSARAIRIGTGRRRVAGA